jgi:1-acyl-sn-glycerol-3-phosphate acyltransferase
MIYTLLKFIITGALRIFFRRIIVRGLENIPENSPVIVSSNHPNAFLDAYVLACFQKNKLYFLARSDAFNTGIKSTILTQLRLIPIYRQIDGHKQLHKNVNTFERSVSLLNKNQSILIFPEALCLMERKLRPLKKGMARIAFSAAEYKADIAILPASINYSKPLSSGGDLILNFAKPIGIDNYLALYKSDKAKALNALTKETENAIAWGLTQIQNRSDEDLYEKIYEILTTEKSLNKFDKIDPFQSSKRAASHVNYLRENNPVALESLRSLTEDYYRLSALSGIKIEHVSKQYLTINLLKIILPKLLLSVITFPLFAAGIIINIFPLHLSRFAAGKMSTHKEFFSSNFITLSALGYILMFTIAAVFTAIVWSWPQVIMLLVLGPLSSIIAANYPKILTDILSLFNLIRNKTHLLSLLKIEQEIISQVNNSHLAAGEDKKLTAKSL